MYAENVHMNNEKDALRQNRRRNLIGKQRTKQNTTDMTR